jgi:2-amino-4-hydroxy-6-hydroxymethyldihydropteridine diphosphokinase
MRTAYIALGSNIQPETNLASAMRFLRRETMVLAASHVYRTPPWGSVPQGDFLNAVVAVSTDLEPPKLLDLLQGIERRHGRTHTIRYGPRTLDLDILAMDGLVLRSPGLMIPHLELHKRGFVLVPLCDFAPHWRHPVLGKTARELLKDLSRDGIERTNVAL